LSRIHKPKQTQSTLLALARPARLLGIPAALTTALAPGPSGPQLPELTEIFSARRSSTAHWISTWHDRRAHEAIIDTGRKKVIIAGTGLDACAQLPALTCAAESSEAYVAVGASRQRPRSPPLAA